MRDAVPCIYDHWIARQICGYLRAGSRKPQKKRSILLGLQQAQPLICPGKPSRESEVSVEDLYRFYEDRAWMTERIEKLEADILALKHLAPLRGGPVHPQDHRV